MAKDQHGAKITASAEDCENQRGTGRGRELISRGKAGCEMVIQFYALLFSFLQLRDYKFEAENGRKSLCFILNIYLKL